MSLIIIILSSGLFLGWLLGSKDTVNLYGASVSSELIDFRVAAVIAAFFIILGSAIHGSGTTETIHSLGQIDQPAVAFLIALIASLVVILLMKGKLQVSTSQTIIGGISGWILFSSGHLQFPVFSGIILAWFLAPLCGLIIGAFLFILIRWTVKRTKIHVIKLDFILRLTLIVAIALSSYGLGANNIGNVVGVFYKFAPQAQIDFGVFSINGIRFLCLLGAIAIAAGVFTYSFRLSKGGSGDTLSLMPEAAIVILFSQAIVLLLFSSKGLQSFFHGIGLPYFALVPVSSTQIVVGALMGIGWVKGAREIDNKSLGSIGLGWIAAPLCAALLVYFVLFVLYRAFGFPEISELNRFSLNSQPETINLVFPGIILVIALILSAFLYLLFRQQKLRLKVEKDLLMQQKQLYSSQKSMYELEMKTFAMENEALNLKLKTRRKEFMDIALNINEQRIFLEKIAAAVNEIIKIQDHNERSDRLQELAFLIRQRMSFSQETKDFYLKVEEIHRDFHLKLKTLYPNLTELEKRLAGLLRLNLSTKEMASLLNISPKSVEVARYRLKKKINLQKDKTLTEYINNL